MYAEAALSCRTSRGGGAGPLTQFKMRGFVGAQAGSCCAASTPLRSYTSDCCWPRKALRLEMTSAEAGLL